MSSQPTPATDYASPGSRRPRLRLSRRLLVFWLLNTVVLSVVLAALPWTKNRRVVLHYTAAWVLAPVKPNLILNDSWQPMRVALAHVSDRPAERLYDALLLRDGVKFQYPPSSLLPLAALDALPGDFWTSDRFLNLLAWPAVILTAAAAAHLFVLLLRLPAGAVALRDSDDDVAAEASGRPSSVALYGVLILLGVTFYPLMRGYVLGQSQTFLTCLITFAMLAWLGGRKALAGALCGLVCLVKPQMSLLVLWGLARREWRFVGALVAVAVAGTVAAVLTFGFDNHLDYVRALSFLSRHGESYHPNQSVNGLMHRLLFNGPNLEWEPNAFPPYHPWVHAVTLVTSLLLIGAAVLYRSREEHGRLLDLATAVLTFTMASPVAWEHHYGVLLPVFAVLAATLIGRRASVPAWVLPALGVSYLLTSNYWRLTDALAPTRLNVLQSYLLIGAAIALVCLYRTRASVERPAA